MRPTKRRSVLRATGLAAVGAGGAALIGPAAPGQPPPPGVETYGIASRTGAIVGAAADGTTAYLVTRGQTPPKLITVDLAATDPDAPVGRITRIDRLPTGEGGWAVAVGRGADDDAVYVGTYPDPDFYRYRRSTGEFETIGRLGPNGGYVWSATCAPDGTVYAGTWPHGKIFEYHPDNGDLRDLGRVDPEVAYARVVAVDERYVHVGTTPQTRLIAIDRSSGDRHDILPSDLTEHGGVGAVLTAAGRVIVAARGVVVDLAPDGSDPVRMPAPDAPDLIDALTVAPDGTLYAAARQLGSLYRRVDDRLELIGQALPGDETRMLAWVDPDTLVGVAGSGVLWRRRIDSGRGRGRSRGRSWNRAGNRIRALDLGDTEVAGSEPAQTIALAPGRGRHAEQRIYVGGHFSITEHRPADGTVRRLRVPGEPKAILPHPRRRRPTLIAAMYPTGDLIELDPRSGKVRTLGSTGMQRPSEIGYHAGSGRILVACIPDNGRLTGALAVLAPATDAITVDDTVLPEQAVVSVAVADDGIVYLAGDTHGGGSIPPERTTAQVAAYDLATRTVLWRTEPLPDAPSLRSIAVADGILFGVYKRPSGTWFAMDLADRTVLRQGRLGGYGQLVADGERVMVATTGDGWVYRLDTTDADDQVVDPDGAVRIAGPFEADDSWFTVPHLLPEPGSSFAWGLVSRRLARIHLPPT